MSVHLPTSLSQLWPLLAEPKAVVMAGGTDLLVRRRARRESGPICCLERIPELCGVEIVNNGQGEALRIGAATPLSALLDEEIVSARLPLLHQALRQLGSPLIRNQATLGGNLCTASPAGDGLPPLLALDASLELASEHDARTLGVEEFLLGPGRSALKPGEIVLAVRIPLPPKGAVQHFEKVGKRRSLAIAVASLAACLRLENGLVAEARLAFGSVAPSAMRCRDAEGELVGRPLLHETLEAAARRVRDAVRPISDVRASAEYRREVAGNLVLRLEPAHKS